MSMASTIAVTPTMMSPPTTDTTAVNVKNRSSDDELMGGADELVGGEDPVDCSLVVDTPPTTKKKHKR